MMRLERPNLTDWGFHYRCQLEWQLDKMNLNGSQDV